MISKSEEINEWRKIQLLSPCIDQTKKDIEKYYRSTPIGAIAVVRQTQGRVLKYTIKNINRRDTKFGRICIANFGDFFMKSGNNCYYPGGQTNLVVPTDEVKAWAAEHPRGEVGISIYRGRAGRK